MTPDEGFESLPESVRAAARIDPNGEVAWPRSEASVAIDALAAAGRVILGTDLRSYRDGILELAWSDFTPPGVSRADDVRAGRNAARDALARAEAEDFHGLDWVLITWQ
jgi:hypothetical protein